MNSGYFLWLTGVDSAIRQLTKTEFRLPSDAVYAIYQEICLQICEHLRDAGIETEIFGYDRSLDGFLIRHRENRIAVFCTQPSPVYLMDFIHREEASHVVFLCTQGAYGRRPYVEIAEHMSYSFIRQSLPEYVYKPAESQNINNIGHITILGNNNNVTIQNVVNKKSKLEKLLDIIKGITTMLKVIGCLLR